MPKATPELRRLRIEAVVKTGQFAERVGYSRNAYSNVEHGHRPGSPEFFQRCAEVLTDLLTERRRRDVVVEANSLYAKAGDDEAEKDDEQKHVSPRPLPPPRPPHEPKRPPNKPRAAERGAA